MLWRKNWLYISRTASRSQLENTMQSNAPVPTRPTQSLLDGKRYERGADVQAVWRKFGWTPPSEKKEAK